MEEPRRVELDAMELHELVASEEGLTSSEMEEKRKEFKTTLEMILWEEVHGKLENKKMTPISKLDEIIFELNENLKATKVKKAPNFLGKHASLKVYVLKKLFEHNYGFLGKDGGKNHQPFCIW